MTSVPVNPCLLRTVHEAHDWWYTSEGGGHMVGADDQDMRGWRAHHCPGKTAADIAPPPAPRPAPAARGSVAAMYGAGLGPDETPHVEQTVDGEDYMVDVNLTPAADVMLQALAVALSSDPDVLAEWSFLVINVSVGQARREVAVRELLGNRKVQEALTIRLTPASADQLRDALDDAAYPPDQCHDYDQGDPCRNYAAPGERQCPRHLPADLVEEYHL
jgi:hypothetical protein